MFHVSLDSRSRHTFEGCWVFKPLDLYSGGFVAISDAGLGGVDASGAAGDVVPHLLHFSWGIHGRPAEALLDLLNDFLLADARLGRVLGPSLHPHEEQGPLVEGSAGGRVAHGHFSRLGASPPLSVTLVRVP